MNVGRVAVSFAGKFSGQEAAGYSCPMLFSSGVMPKLNTLDYPLLAELNRLRQLAPKLRSERR
jgi:hypothetical protein